MNIIDAHVHLDLKRYPDYRSAARALLSEMDKAKVEKCVIMPDGMDCDSETVRKACEVNPDRMSGFYMPAFGKKSIPVKLDKALKAGNFKGIKIHPRTQKIFLGDPRLDLVLKECSALGIPVFIDCFPFGVPDERNYPIAFDGIAKKYPSLKLIMGHMGGHRALDAFIVAKSNKNVYLDVSFTFIYFRGSSIGKDVGYIVKSLGSGRCIYGSDYPHVDMEESKTVFLKLLDSTGLNRIDMEKIMGGNITSMLGL